jgi:hypothetical protein
VCDRLDRVGQPTVPVTSAARLRALPVRLIAFHRYRRLLSGGQNTGLGCFSLVVAVSVRAFHRHTIFST